MIVARRSSSTAAGLLVGMLADSSRGSRAARPPASPPGLVMVSAGQLSATSSPQQWHAVTQCAGRSVSRRKTTARASRRGNLTRRAALSHQMSEQPELGGPRQLPPGRAPGCARPCIRLTRSAEIERSCAVPSSPAVFRLPSHDDGDRLLYRPDPRNPAPITSASGTRQWSSAAHGRRLLLNARHVHRVDPAFMRKRATWGCARPRTSIGDRTGYDAVVAAAPLWARRRLNRRRSSARWALGRDAISTLGCRPTGNLLTDMSTRIGVVIGRSSRYYRFTTSPGIWSTVLSDTAKMVRKSPNATAKTALKTSSSLCIGITTGE